MMRDSSGLALSTGSSADNVNYGDPKEHEHTSADPSLSLILPSKVPLPRPPNTAQHDAGGLKQMELKGSGASVAAA